MIRIESKPLHEIKSDAFVINIFSDESQVPENLTELDEVTIGLISGAIRDKELSGTLFQVTSFYRPRGLLAKRLLIVGSGTRRDFNFEIVSDCGHR